MNDDFTGFDCLFKASQFGMSSYKWHVIIQVACHHTSGMSSYKWHVIIQVACHHTSGGRNILIVHATQSLHFLGWVQREFLLCYCRGLPLVIRHRCFGVYRSGIPTDTVYSAHQALAIKIVCIGEITNSEFLAIYKKMAMIL